jgi:hypothetical protein
MGLFWIFVVSLAVFAGSFTSLCFALDATAEVLFDLCLQLVAHGSTKPRHCMLAQVPWLTTVCLSNVAVTTSPHASEQVFDVSTRDSNRR